MGFRICGPRIHRATVTHSKIDPFPNGKRYFYPHATKDDLRYFPPRITRRGGKVWWCKLNQTIACPGMCGGGAAYPSPGRRSLSQKTLLPIVTWYASRWTNDPYAWTYGQREYTLTTCPHYGGHLTTGGRLRPDALRLPNIVFMLIQRKDLPQTQEPERVRE